AWRVGQGGKAGVDGMGDVNVTERQPELEGQRQQRHPSPMSPVRAQPTHRKIPTNSGPCRKCNNITFSAVKVPGADGLLTLQAFGGRPLRARAGWRRNLKAVVLKPWANAGKSARDG